VASLDHRFVVVGQVRLDLLDMIVRIGQRVVDVGW
jgi:hypothetical protein